jgi:ATP/maltotriose-dependent transcriptional regulator MalT
VGGTIQARRPARKHHRGLILVDAPAGFGKTILVAQWRASLAGSRPFAWVSLDRGDNDPGRLWWYVVTALQRACPQIGGEAILAERTQGAGTGLHRAGAAHARQRAGRAAGTGGPGA